MFDLDIEVAEIPKIFRRFKGLAGWDVIRPRAERLKGMEKDMIYRDYVQRRFAIELMLMAFDDYLKKTNRIPKHLSTARGYYQMLAFIAAYVRAYDLLTEVGKKKLRGEIKKAMDGDRGLAPFAFELKILVGVISSGYTVKFNDWDGNDGGFDFLAVKNDKEMEIECKLISPDLGRKVTEANFHNLCRFIRPIVDEFLLNLKGGKLISLKLTNRLEKTVEEFEAIKEDLITGLNSDGEYQGKSGVITSALFDFDIERYKHVNANNLDIDALREQLTTRFKLEDPNSIIVFNQQGGCLIFTVSSQVESNVMAKIEDKLKDDAKRQFSKTRAAFLFVKFTGIENEHLIDIASADKDKGHISALKVLGNTLLDRYDHLLNVTFMAEGEIDKTVEIFGQNQLTSSRESMTIYSFTGHTHPNANDPDYQIFNHND